MKTLLSQACVVVAGSLICVSVATAHGIPPVAPIPPAPIIPPAPTITNGTDDGMSPEERAKDRKRKNPPAPPKETDSQKKKDRHDDMTKAKKRFEDAQDRVTSYLNGRREPVGDNNLYITGDGPQRVDYGWAKVRDERNAARNRYDTTIALYEDQR